MNHKLVALFGVAAGAVACSTSDDANTAGSKAAPSAGGATSNTTQGESTTAGAGVGGSQGSGSGASGGSTASDATGSAGTKATMGPSGTGGSSGSTTTTLGGAGPTGTAGALGAHPFEPSPVTLGGTMTFTNVGAAGWWPRRVERNAGTTCDYKDGTDTWGGDCCMTAHETESSNLSPFDEEMTLILKAVRVKQLAVYQPTTETARAGWRRVSAWDSREPASDNLWFTQEGEGSSTFPGDLTANDCVGYVSQAPSLACEEVDYFCPDDPGILHQGFVGSKLVVFLGSMSFDDAGVASCDGDGLGHPGPWVAFVASELVRDGGRKWNGLCNCYSKTDSVGDGCGEINVFEVVLDDNDFSNREFMSTGLRSFQEGHVGGNVCGAGCDRDAFAEDVEVVDACTQTAYSQGPELEVGGNTDGCPVWRRPDGDRYFLIALDEVSRVIQVSVIHPANIPEALGALLPELPLTVGRDDIDALLGLRLPQ